MSKKLTVSLFIGIFLCGSIQAHAFNYKERKTIKRQKKRIYRSGVSYFNSSCKTKLRTRIMWRSFRKNLHVNYKNPALYCPKPLFIMHGYCRQGFAKAIKKQVRKYVCRHGKKGQFRVTLRNRTLTYWIDWKLPRVEKHLREKLGELIKIKRNDGIYTLDEERSIRAQRNRIKRSGISYFESGCKAKIKTVIEWNSLRKNLNVNYKNPALYCPKPLFLLYKACRKGQADMITKKVKQYVCRYGGKGGSSLTLKNGTLTFSIDWKQPRIDTFLRKKIETLF